MDNFDCSIGCKASYIPITNYHQTKSNRRFITRSFPVIYYFFYDTAAIFNHYCYLSKSKGPAPYAKKNMNSNNLGSLLIIFSPQPARKNEEKH